MSVLEFIAAWKWPVVVLVALAYSRWMFRKNPSLAAWFKKLIEKRDVSAELGPAKLQLTTPASQAAVLTAAATDEELTDAALEELAAHPGGDVDFDGLDVAEVRRGAIEVIMRDAAAWGWEMARLGFQSPPDPQVRWGENGQPEILYGTGDLISRTLIVSPREDRAADEARRRADLQAAIRRRMEESERRSAGDGRG